MEGGGEAGRGWATTRPSGGRPSSVRQQTEHEGEEERRVRGEAGCSGTGGAFYSAGAGEAAGRRSSTVAVECILKSAVSKSEGGRGVDEVLSY
jgi:hypothetical protein